MPRRRAVLDLSDEPATCFVAALPLATSEAVSEAAAPPVAMSRAGSGAPGSTKRWSVTTMSTPGRIGMALNMTFGARVAPHSTVKTGVSA